MALKPVVLCILDGWGLRAESEANAPLLAHTPNFDRIWAEEPHAQLSASGEDVGLPPGQIGNSEVGHTNIGAGRVVWMDLPKIDRAIEDGTFFSKEPLVATMMRLKQTGGTAHILGLLSPGGVHSHQRHIAMLARAFSGAGIPVAIHAFMDGRDVAPKSGRDAMDAFRRDVLGMPGVRIATVCGRFYAMDRDNRWERVERAFRLLADGDGAGFSDPLAAIDAAYASDVTDEFIDPAAIDGYPGMMDGDGLESAWRAPMNTIAAQPKWRRRAPLSLMAGCLMLSLGAAQAQPDWVAESNANAQVVLESFARFAPEGAGRLGVDGLDEEVLDLRPRIFERGIFAAEQALAELKSRRGKSSFQAVEQDLEILIQATEDGIHTARLQQDLLLQHTDAAQTVFNGIQALLDPRIPKQRQPAALVRLRKYAGLVEGYEPLPKLAMDRASERFSEEGLVGPYVAEIEESLNNSQRYIEGTRQLFADSELEGWEQPFEVLAGQLNEYNEWVREEILPRARSEHRLPAALYADNLKNVGVDINPEVLIQRALNGFMEIRNEMNAVAALIAEQRGWDSGDYRDVIRELKKEQFEGDAVLPFFKERLAQIEDIIRREDIVSLPDREAVIRLASEAETARQPAPHVSPPRLIGNTGEPAEFVLPLVVPAGEGESNLPYDDFTFDAAAWTLTVHEARPGMNCSSPR